MTVHGRLEPLQSPAQSPERRQQAQPGRTFQWPLRVYWEDTDAGGIVFYANYLKFFERARTEWLRSLGIEQHSLKEQSGGMFVVADTTVRYRRPARLDDEVLVTARLAEPSRASLTIFQQAFLKPNVSLLLNKELVGQINPGLEVNKSTLLCEGSIRIGWVNANTLQPGRIPDHVLHALNGQP
ncbi:MAG: YbgC/FadM family acyl-CoA thioesterase [Polaromonas sp.]|nr:YbgC/FadM family acyl-CoA thioesterase [Polaromonas sp.]